MSPVLAPAPAPIASLGANGASWVALPRWAQLWFPHPWAAPAPPRPRAPRTQHAEPRRKCSPHPRARTLPSEEIPGERRGVLLLPFIYQWERTQRPATRGDCLPGGRNAMRPCPWVSCRHHLGIEVNEDNGKSIKVLFPGKDGMPNWGAMVETCSLDVADRVALADTQLELEEIGKLTNRSRERVYQISNKAAMEVLVKRKRLGR